MEPPEAVPREARHVGPLGAEGQLVRARERADRGQGASAVEAHRVARQESETLVLRAAGAPAYVPTARSGPSIEMACTLSVEYTAGVRL